VAEFEHAAQPIALARRWWPLTATPLAGTVLEQLPGPSPANFSFPATSNPAAGSAALTATLPRIECAPIFEALIDSTPVRISTKTAGPAIAPEASPVEQMVFAASAPQEVAFAAAATGPVFALRAAFEPGMAGLVQSPAAQAVERMVASIASAEPVAAPRIAAIGPAFELTAIAEPAPSSKTIAGPVLVPAAQAAERFVVPAAATAWVASTHAPRAVALTVTPITDRRTAPPTRVLQPAAVERFVVAVADPRWAASAHQPRAVAMTVAPIVDRRTAPPTRVLQPAAVERFVVAAAATEWSAAAAIPRSPQFAVTLLADAERRTKATACAPPVPSPAAQPVESFLISAAPAGSLAFSATLQLPAFTLRPAALAPAPPRTASQKVLAFPDPASQLDWKNGHPRSATPALTAREVAYGSMPQCGHVPVLEACAVESMPSAAFAAVPVLGSSEARLPQFAMGRAADESEPESIAAMFPVTDLSIVRHEADQPLIPSQAPVGPVVQLEYHCVRSTAAPIVTLNWSVPDCNPVIPALPVTPIFDRREEPVTPKKPVNPNSIADIFRMPEARRRQSNATAMVFKAAAACIVLGSMLWFGSSAVRIGRQTPAVNRDVSAVDTAVGPSNDTATTAAGPMAEIPAAQGTGPVARLRRAVANRASATVTDSFKNGMEAWGTSPKSWAAGWSRSADGYVNTGALALFRPSLGFADYRLEFFGQIEQKSMGWAVRAHDAKNYYAMKVSVVQPGLRPIIAIEHYPVVDGKRGKAAPIPLNVMVHNNSPIQVAVDVRGNKLVTSVDGQEVDTWIDDTLPSGGVGFFAENGSRARLYWMKVAKNEDFLGRVCAYISRKLGDGSNTTAELWDPSLPLPGPAPQKAPRREDYALAPAEMPTQFSRRTQPWRS